MAEVLTTAQSAPLASTHRLVLVHDAQLAGADAIERFAAYAARPQPSTCLVLMVSGALPASAPWKALAGLASVVGCQAPEGPALRQWINERARQLDKQVSADAATLLEEQWGRDLLALANALDQAACYVGGRAVIEETDVEALGGRHPQATVFQWTEMIVRRDASAALQFLAVQQREGKTAPQLIGMLTWQFDRLLRAKRLQTAGAPEGRVLAAAGINQPRWRGLFLRQLGGYTLPQLQAAMTLMLETDVAAKRGRMTPELAVELLVVRLCGSEAVPR